jgi:hypothetical protein
MQFNHHIYHQICGTITNLCCDLDKAMPIHPLLNACVLPEGTVGYQAQPGLIHESVSEYVSLSVR